MSVDFNASFSGSAETFGAKMTETPASMTASMKETGGGSASNYEALRNKPKINGHELIGDMTPAQLGITDDRHHTHKQAQAAKVWTVAHNLGKRPAVTVVDSAGTVVIGEVDYLDDNTVRLTFCAAFIRTGATAFGADWLSKTSGGAALTPESDKIYVILSEGEYQNKTYRWSGTTYAVIGNDLAIGETASTAYRGDRGKTAYDHSQSAHAPADAEKNVQSDWNETDGNSDAFIKNKPTIPKAVTKTVQTLSDAASKSFTVTGYILSVILIDSVTKEQVIGDVSFENATASANGKVTVTLAAAPSNPILVIITSIAL